MEDMAFDDLILESVQSVTKAATSLINAATVAQKVLVAQGKMSKNAKKVLLVRIPIQTYTNFRGRRTVSGHKGWYPQPKSLPRSLGLFAKRLILSSRCVANMERQENIAKGTTDPRVEFILAK